MYGIIHRSFKGCIPSSQVQSHSLYFKSGPMVFILVKKVLGKLFWLKHLMGTDHLLMKRQQVLDTFLFKVRKRRWMNEISTHPKLTWRVPHFEATSSDFENAASTDSVAYTQRIENDLAGF